MNPHAQPIPMQQNYNMDVDSSSRPASYVKLAMGSPMSWSATSLAGSPMSWQLSSQYASSSMTSAFGDNPTRDYTCCESQYATISDLLEHYENEHVITGQAAKLLFEERPQPTESLILSPLDLVLDLPAAAKVGHKPSEIGLTAPISDVFPPATSRPESYGHSWQAPSLMNESHSSAIRPLVKPFKCPRPNCGKSYKQANGLKYHLKYCTCNSMNQVGTISNPAPPSLREEDHVDLLDEDRSVLPFDFKCGLSGCIQQYKSAYELGQHYQQSHRDYAVEPLIFNDILACKNPSAVSKIAPTEPIDLTGKVSCVSRYPEHGGGYADIFVGHFNEGEHGKTKVAIKVLRSHIYKNSDKTKLHKRLSREIKIWACFNHPNVLPLLGTAVIFDSNVSMVCPWMEEGDLAGYLSRKKDVLTPELRMVICEDITNGLQYIHSRNFVHGDLTTGNVLVDGNGKAKLSDFGLSNMKADLCVESFKTSKVAGSARWAAPELIWIDDIVAQADFRSDVYSLGSVIFHVMSGQPPYEGLSEAHIILKVTIGNKPAQDKPQTLTENCWRLIKRCWELFPADRPTTDQVKFNLALLQSPSDLAIWSTYNELQPFIF